MERNENTSSFPLFSSFIIHHSSLSLPLILVLGGVLRLVPIWFGLPYVTARPDEETSLGHAVAILGGDRNPHFFHWPSLTFYLFAGLFQIASTLRGLLGLAAELTDAQRLLIGRGCVALAGTATVAVLFGLGRRVGGKPVGLTAALFLAVSILHVRESHFAMTDALMTFFATASLALLLTGFEDEGCRTREWAAAGLAGGLAASTKYTAVALLASLAVAHLLVAMRERRALWRVWLASGAFLALFAFGFIVGTPFAVLDTTKFGVDFGFNFTHLSEGHVVNLGRGWMYHLARSLPYGVSPPVFIAAVAGAVPFARHHGAHGLIVGAFALVTYASLGNGYTVFFRYVLPIVPIVCLSAAIAVVELGRLARHRGDSRDSRRVLAAALAAWGAINCIWFDTLLAKKDTRVLAREWLDAHTTRNEALYEAENAYAMLDLETLPVHSWRFDPVTASFVNADGRVPDWLVLHESPLWTYAAIPTPLRRLAAERYDLAQTIAATKGTARQAVYDLQDAFFMPVSGFSTVIRPGPTVLIYRRRD
jgi:4-amino-4-deoxy-L-arabinose transferase-like glycosyltransferase